MLFAWLRLCRDHATRVQPEALAHTNTQTAMINLEVMGLIYRVSVKLLYSLTNLDKLRNVIVPALKQRPDFNKLYFRQDGAPPHYATAVRNLLDETFPDKWIGRRGPIEFPPRSPDITPMDFFVWGVIKDSVYSRKPRSVEDLRQFVIDGWHLPTLIMTCAPKFVIVWCHVVENVLKLKASNLNICHRNCLP